MLTLGDRYFVLANGDSTSPQRPLSLSSDPATPDDALGLKVLQVRLRPGVLAKSGHNLLDHMLDLTPMPADPRSLPRGCLWRFTADGCIMSALSPALSVDLVPPDHYGSGIWRGL